MKKTDAAAIRRGPDWQRLRVKLCSRNTLIKALWSVFRLILLLGLSYVIFFPFLVKLSNVFMSKTDLFDSMVKFIPRDPSLDNLKFVFEAMDYPRTFANTLLLSLVCAALQVIVACMSGYGLAKFQFRGKGVLFAFVVLSMLVPAQTIQMASYVEFKYFDLFGLITLIRGKPVSMINTVSPMLFLSATGFAIKNGLYIFIMRQCFLGVPKELSEAASVDGAGVFRTFFRINMPSVRAMMVTIFLLAFSWQWLDTYYSSLYYPSYHVLPNMIDQVANYYSPEFGQLHNGSPLQSMYLNTAAVTVMFPLLILYFFTQKAFVQGIETSGIVG